MGGSSPSAFVILLALIGGGMVALLEWRRGNERRRLARVGVSMAAVIGLALLGVYRPKPETLSHLDSSEAVLWTPRANSGDNVPPTYPHDALHVALPGAIPRGVDAIAIPDVAYLRRHYPGIKVIRILGDGLEPYDLEILDGLQIKWEAFDTNPSEPTIAFVQFPQRLTAGDNLEVRGSIDGLRAAELVTLTLESPDGTTTETTLAGRDAEKTPFLIAAPPVAAEGRFLCRLRMVSGKTTGRVLVDRPLGISVVAPSLPRVLVLESSPSFETSHLQRWLDKIGASFVSRTRIGRERYRFVSSRTALREFLAVDTQLLRSVDVLITDVGVLAALNAAERDALRIAMADQGLGVLLLWSGEPALRAMQSDFPESSFFLPWKITGAAAGQEAADDRTRSTRVQWAGLPSPSEHLISIASYSIEPGAGASKLVTDSQGRPVVSSVRRGRGEIAVSMVRDTWRWRLEDQSETFAKYWSFLLTRLAKRPDLDTPRWALDNADAFPLLVNQPIQLSYCGATEAPPISYVVGDDPAKRVAISFVQSLAEPRQWQATFWPRRSGWHRVLTSENGAHLDFFVYAAQNWPALSSTRRQAATLQFATLRQKWATESRTPVTKRSARPNAFGAIPYFVLFFLSASYLWIERRLVG